MRTSSPLIHGCLRTLDDWKRQLIVQLDAFPGGCPESFLPRMCIDRKCSSVDPPLHKYRCLSEADNTPFVTSRHAEPVRRLWLYLVGQDHLIDHFIRYVFKPKAVRSEVSLLYVFLVSTESCLVWNLTYSHAHERFWMGLFLVYLLWLIAVTIKVCLSCQTKGIYNYC